MSETTAAYEIETFTLKGIISMLTGILTAANTSEDYSAGDNKGLSTAGILYNASEISSVMSTIATSMTDTMRDDRSPMNVTIRGTAFQTEPYIEVNWGWIALPAVLILMSGVSLAMTILESYGGNWNEIWCGKLRLWRCLLVGFLMGLISFPLILPTRRRHNRLQMRMELAMAMIMFTWMWISILREARRKWNGSPSR
ncbi:hypothetical protein BDV19DRAFT_391611 [Aspergillus venezuelensis]